MYTLPTDLRYWSTLKCLRSPIRCPRFQSSRINTRSITKQVFTFQLHAVPKRFVQHALPGKTNNLLAFYKNHKWKIIVGGITVSSLLVFGTSVLTFTLKFVLVVAGIIGLIFIVWRFRRQGTLVLFPVVERELHRNRRAIEKVIGSFEVPSSKDLIVFKSQTPHPSYKLLLYTFNLQGSRGAGIASVRAVQLDHFDTKALKGRKEWVIEKYRVDVQSIGGQIQTINIIERNLTTPVIVDKCVVLAEE